MADSNPTGTLPSSAEPELSYEAVEPWAIGAFLLGLVAPLALAAPVLWFMPLLGMVASALALVRIRRAAGRPGRKLALAGLGLSTFFLAVPIAQTVSMQWLLARQARPVADQFLEFLRQGSPEKALQLNTAPDFRHPLDDALWMYYRRNAEAGRQLKKFVADPTIRMLLALGDRAEVRYYRTTGAGAHNDLGQVDLWYTITFPAADGQKKTYFLSLYMERRATTDPELNPWRVKTFLGGVKPGR